MVPPPGSGGVEVPPPGSEGVGVAPGSEGVGVAPESDVLPHVAAVGPVPDEAPDVWDGFPGPPTVLGCCSDRLKPSQAVKTKGTKVSAALQGLFINRHPFLPAVVGVFGHDCQ